MKKLGLFPIIMIVIIGSIIVLSIAIPLRKAYQSKNDRLIENNLPNLGSEISSYYRENKKLPESLNDLEVSNRDAKKLVTNNLVAYKIVSQGIYTTDQYSNKLYDSSSTSTYQDTSAKYELCVVYKFASNDDYRSSDAIRSEEYTTYISAYRHPAGEACYKLRPSNY